MSQIWKSRWWKCDLWCVLDASGLFWALETTTAAASTLSSMQLYALHRLGWWRKCVADWEIAVGDKDNSTRRFLWWNDGLLGDFLCSYYVLWLALYHSQWFGREKVWERLGITWVEYCKVNLISEQVKGFNHREVRRLFGAISPPWNEVQ